MSTLLRQGTRQGTQDNNLCAHYSCAHLLTCQLKPPKPPCPAAADRVSKGTFSTIQAVTTAIIHINTMPRQINHKCNPCLCQCRGPLEPRKPPKTPISICSRQGQQMHLFNNPSSHNSCTTPIEHVQTDKPRLEPVSVSMQGPS